MFRNVRPAALAAVAVDADGILLIDEGPLAPGVDPLDLDAVPVCRTCRGPLSHFEGEDYCPECLAFVPTE